MMTLTASSRPAFYQGIDESGREWHHRTVNGRRIMVCVPMPAELNLGERIRVIRGAVAVECRRRWGEGQLRPGLLGLKWCRSGTEAGFSE